MVKNAPLCKAQHILKTPVYLTQHSPKPKDV